MNPYDHPELYDVITLGDRVSPGVVTLTGHDRNPDWDIKAAKGQTGASTSLNGQPIGMFQASFYLADDEEFQQWDEFQRHIESTTNGPKPVALPVYHPDLARNKFTEVVNGGISGVIHDRMGGMTVQVKFIEYKPPKPRPPQKAASKASGNTGKTDANGNHQPAKPDPNAGAKQELAGLLEEAKKP